jgi:DNA-binding PadR family transcriptional regulator
MFGKDHDYMGSRIIPMQLVILLLLRKRPMYGYEVLKELRERSRAFGPPRQVPYIPR